MYKYLLILILFTSCSEGLEEKDQYDILFLSHTRTDDRSNLLIPEVEKHNYQKYDALILGGDFLEETCLNDGSLTYLDSVWNISSDYTLVSIGNHEEKNIEKLLDKTNKDAFYVQEIDDLPIVVLDTQSDSCNIIEDQLKMIQNISDTISKAKNIIFVSHKLIWLPEHPELDSLWSTVSNGQKGHQKWDLMYNNFHSDVYPLLKEIQGKGCQVYFYSGDLGNRKRFFEYKTQEGIKFMASGLNYDDEEHYAWVLKYNKIEKSIIWQKIKL